MYSGGKGEPVGPHPAHAGGGCRLSLDKGERGGRLTWIGTVFELTDKEIIPSAPQKLIDEVRDELS